VSESTSVHHDDRTPALSFLPEGAGPIDARIELSFRDRPIPRSGRPPLPRMLMTCTPSSAGLR
jgi:hypothetical protein